MVDTTSLTISVALDSNDNWSIKAFGAVFGLSQFVGQWLNKDAEVLSNAVFGVESEFEVRLVITQAVVK